MVIQSVSTYETSSNSPSFTFAPAIPIVGYTIIKHQNQMQVLEEIKVSVYENVYSKKPKIMSFLEFIRFMLPSSNPSGGIIRKATMKPPKN